MDTEVFELCKEVWIKTAWELDPEHNYGVEKTTYEARYGKSIIYTSDYLLEKLPRFINTKVDRLHKEHGCDTCTCERSYKTYLEIHQSDEKSLVCYVSGLNSRAIPFLERADTLTKALLKLTLALHAAGELEQRSIINGSKK